jgi:hypothetical protein
MMQVPAAGRHRAAETQLTPKSAAHGSFTVWMSRGDAGHKENTMNLLSPWSVVFFIPNILSLDFSFCPTEAPPVPAHHT